MMYRDSETGLVIHRGVISHSPVVVRLIQVVNFLFGLLYTLFVVRFVLEYIGARPVGFVQLIQQWSEPFYHPFRGIVANGSDPGGHPLAWSIVIAVVAYALLNAAIVALLRMATRASDVD
jgi:uncharacterized protein YggT (Ycf19 family)